MTKKNIHIGFAILKSFLAFDVIISHCFNKNTTKNLIILKIAKRRKIHVPSFIIMSFYFTHNSLISHDLNKIFNRFERLLIPYIGWPFIILILFNALNYFFDLNYRCTIKNFIYQIIIAQAPNIPLHFWFLFDLIVTNMIFIFIIFIMKKYYLFAFEIVIFLSYYLQYSQLNLIFYTKLNSKQSLGREIEIIPFAVTGFILSDLNIINKLDNRKLATFFFSLLIYNFSVHYSIFREIQGISYSGVKLNIHSVCIIFLFSLFSNENLKNNYFKKVIIQMTKFTGGIFYIHQLIHDMFQFHINDIKKGTFFGLFLIYLFSYLICFIGSVIFGKTKAKFLFE